MKAIFRHIGGKNILGEELVGLMPGEKPDIYIEPFGGSFGAGIETGHDPQDIVMVHNDLDSIIHSIFKAVSSEPEATLDAVYVLLDKYEYSQDTVNYFRMLFDYMDHMGENLFGDDICLGAAGWILKEITYNGNCMQLGKSESAGIIQKLEEKFYRREETACGLKGVVALHMDALDLLKRVEELKQESDEKVFIYVDAPYSHSGKRKTKKDLYRVDIGKDDKMVVDLAHQLERLNSHTDCKIMVSEYDNPIYDSILTCKKGWEKVKVQDVYKYSSVAYSYGGLPIETEYIWRNYH